MSSPAMTRDFPAAGASWVTAARRHWPEYLIEAAGLGLFMVSACGFATLLESPGSVGRMAIPDPVVRRVLMGLAMGSTSIALIYSRWGMRSGAHFNPAVTLTFWRLGRVPSVDAALYMAAQFLGAPVGVILMAALLGPALASPPVNFVATVPGPQGPGVAFAAEVAISALLMLTVLFVSNSPRFSRLTGLCAGALVATYISLEAPLSGMSMNPARTVGSALGAGHAPALWIYFIAPPLGMLLAAELYVRLLGSRGVFCAKLHHDDSTRCIFCEARRARNPEP